MAEITGMTRGHGRVIIALLFALNAHVFTIRSGIIMAAVCWALCLVFAIAAAREKL